MCVRGSKRIARANSSARPAGSHRRRDVAGDGPLERVAQGLKDRGGIATGASASRRLEVRVRRQHRGARRGCAW